MTDHSAANLTVDSTINKIKQRQARLGIIGLGYVWLPLTLLFTDQRLVVTGRRYRQRKVDTLTQGGSYIYRIGADEINAANAQGFSATNDYARIEDMDASIICVPTPLNEYHEPDLSFITDTTHAIAPTCSLGSWWFSRAQPILERHPRSNRKQRRRILSYAQGKESRGRSLEYRRDSKGRLES